MIKKTSVALLVSTIAFLASLVYPSIAGAQTRFTAGIETTAGYTVDRTYDNPPSSGVIIHTRRWMPSERMIRLSYEADQRLTLTGSLSVGSNIVNPPQDIDTETGRQSIMIHLESYAGKSRHMEFGGEYKVLPQLAITGGYAGYRLFKDMRFIHYTSFDGSGYYATSSRTDRYNAMQVGAKSVIRLDKVTLVPSFEFYPYVKRGYDSQEFVLGATYENGYHNMGKSKGYKLAGRLSYELIEHLSATAGYSFQEISTKDEHPFFGGPQTTRLKTKGATFGLQVGF